MASTSGIHISGGTEDLSVRARAELADRGKEMSSELAAKVELAMGLRLSSVDREAARTRLVTFCAVRVLPHLEAIDQVLYAVAAGAAETRLLVRSLRLQHQQIARQIETLNRADGDGARAAVASYALLTLFEECQRIEKIVLLPALAALPGVDLPSLVEDLDTVLQGGVLVRPEVLDVRDIPHGQRHPRIFGLYARLAPGESFVLVNNHDPKPLRREFEAAYPEQFSWEYEQSGPSKWGIRIGRRLGRAS